jgi:hypothetical protein
MSSPTPEEQKAIQEEFRRLDPYLDNRLRSSKPCTPLDFIDNMRALWKATGHGVDIIRHTPFDRETEYPFPLITFRTVRRVINNTFKDEKPRYRQTIRHPYNPDEYVELRGQMFDVWMEFAVHSNSQEEADEITEELDDFLNDIHHRGFFKQNGVQEMRFFAQLEDLVIADYRFPIAVRTIQYTFRFEKITPIFLSQIERITAFANVQSAPVDQSF